MKHLVIMMADQLRYDAAPGLWMKNLEQLQNESVVFNSCRCASPLCVPARGSFFTGLYPNETGSLINPWSKKDKSHGFVREGIENLFTLMGDNWDIRQIGKQHFLTKDPLPDYVNISYDDKGYAAHLKEAGKRKPGGLYFRSLVPELVSGKITQASSYSNPRTGCYPEDERYYFDGYFLEGCLNAIETRDKSKPLFLNAMMLAPHPPLEIPEPWYSLVKDVNLPENVGVWYEKQSPLQLYNITGAIGTKYNLEEWRESWRVYLGLTAMLDDYLGKIIAKLKEEGIYDDTLFIFTSDHGEMLGSHQLWQKMCMYEESVRTPLVVRFPKDYVPQCKDIGTNVSHIDILPTIADYLGLDISSKVSGNSLMPLIDGKTFSKRDLFIQYGGNGSVGNFQRCIIRDEFKLIVDIFKDELFFELYNTEEDKMESNNLAFSPEYKDLAENMFKSLKDFMSETNDMLSLEADAFNNFLKTR